MDLVELRRFGSDQEAQVFAAALRSHGLHPTVASAGLATLVGAGYNAVPARILIPEIERPDALVLMEAVRASMEDSASGPETCPACGSDWEPGFSVCWSCNHAL